MVWLPSFVVEGGREAMPGCVKTRHVARHRPSPRSRTYPRSAAIGVAGGFDGKRAIQRIGRLHERPVLLVTVCWMIRRRRILLQRADAIGAHGLFQRQRAVVVELLDQRAVARGIANHMLRRIVLAGDPVAVDFARAIGKTLRFVDFVSCGIERELLPRTVGMPGCDRDQMAIGIVVGCIDRTIAVRHLPEGEIAVGEVEFDERGVTGGVDADMLRV